MNIQKLIMSPQLKGSGATYCFGADPIGIHVASCLHSIFWTNGWILTKLAHMHYWDGGKKWLDFGDLNLIFKVTPALDQKKLVCTLSLEPNDRFWPNFINCNVGMV